MHAGLGIVQTALYKLQSSAALQSMSCSVTLILLLQMDKRAGKDMCSKGHVLKLSCVRSSYPPISWTQTTSRPSEAASCSLIAAPVCVCNTPLHHQYGQSTSCPTLNALLQEWNDHRVGSGTMRTHPGQRPRHTLTPRQMAAPAFSASGELQLDGLGPSPGYAAGGNGHTAHADRSMASGSSWDDGDHVMGSREGMLGSGGRRCNRYQWGPSGWSSALVTVDRNGNPNSGGQR